MRYFLIIFFILIIVFSVYCIIIYQGIYYPKDSASQEEAFFAIEKGQGVKQIAENLEAQGLIKNKWYFMIYVYFREIARELKAGDYLLSPSMTISQIAEKFFLGDIAREKIVIFEGWNLRDIAYFFEEKGRFTSEEFFELTGFPATATLETSGLPFLDDFSDKFDFLADKPRNISLEGYLFPDTYEIYKDDGLKEVIERMLTNFGEKLTPEIREEIKAQEKTIFEIITMASMLEKEVRTLKDKKIVAGILWKRLEDGMPLQIDATVNYITAESRRQVLISETEIDSPYNTYKYKGLPLGPIANPGDESILAAIYPKESSYWYYLSARNGVTIFSRTFKEHKAARAIYLK